MREIILNLIIASIVVAYAIIALVLAKRQRAKRNLKSPDEFVLLRAPGETLRKEVETISERIFDHLAFGSAATLLLVAAPPLLKLDSHMNPFALLLSSAALFLTCLASRSPAVARSPASALRDSA